MCHKSKLIEVKDKKVIVSDIFSFEEILSRVDYFLALDIGYAKYEDKGNRLIIVPIPDGGIREDAFLIAKTLLDLNAVLGIGCVNGHGRTGWLLGRLIHYYEGICGEELIRKVRSRGCEWMIETDEQYRDLWRRTGLGI